MSNIPLPANENERLESLRSYNILDTLEEAEYNEIVLVASEICQTPVALISLVDHERQWFKSIVGVDLKQTPKEQAFCAYTIVENDVMIVKDARNDPRFAQNPLVTGFPNIVFYAGVPLITNDGHALGSLCVIDNKVNDLTPQQINALKVLSKQVSSLLELRKKNRELEEANVALMESNLFIQRFAGMVAHDIKNPLSSMLLSSQALQRQLQSSDDIKSLKLVEMNIRSSKQLLHLVDEILVYSTSPSSMLARRELVNVSSLITKLMKLIEIPASIHIELPEKEHILHVPGVALEQIFLNLLTNAIRYNDKPEGLISFQVTEDAEYFTIEVTDNGIGIEPQYITRIFDEKFTAGRTDRFDKKGTGIGLSTVKALVEKLGGTVYARSVLGQETTICFTVKKPADA
ncbi:GAF domain-containing sensor histidine kinase [Mucilaginibacter daejeonensis]|uniref:GAF domain-containing sensor histidine kinase n=1 Tax=Mucilaginibacter daejeonensis TaxID=398049 RepID=UPI001D17646C|nr:GAF domain-containing sensor histidine kinase [Mucilaginibacter daejeonensis]UEG53464.1 GAF domain-containing sensor histidine kinase [Mucilaginibacter daejeonensis]